MGNKNNKGVIITLVAIIIILIALIVLMGTGKINFKFNSNKNKSIDNSTKETNNVSTDSKVIEQKSTVNKTKILEYYKEKLSNFTDPNFQYSIIDINNDDIPELFIYVTGTIGNQIIADTSIYTYDENKGDKLNDYIVNIGSISGRIDNDTILYKMKDGSLLSVIAKMGYENKSYYKLENDWLVRTDFASKETNDYTVGDYDIQFKACTDLSLIENYK